MEKVHQDKLAAAISVLSILEQDGAYSPIFKELNKAADILNEIIEFRPKNTTFSETDCHSFEYMPNDDGTTLAIKQYIGFDEETIVIPTSFEGKIVTRISANAFKNSKHLKRLILSDSVTVIGSSAFEGCAKLEQVDNTSRVKYLGGKAFFDCANLSKVGTFNSLKYIGKEAFSNTAITSFVLPDNIKYLCKRSFCNCSKLASVTLHNRLKMIGDHCFDGCQELKDIEIPHSVSYVGYSAFQNCISLRKLIVRTINAVWKEAAFAKTRIWRPDLRYNPRTIFESLPNIEILCFPGATIQAYCRDNNLKCSRLQEELLRIDGEDLTLDSLVGFRIIKPSYPTAQKEFEKLEQFLSQYDIVVEEEPLNVLSSHNTTILNIHILGTAITEMKKFEEHMTGHSQSQRFRDCKVMDEYRKLIKEKGVTVKNEVNI